MAQKHLGSGSVAIWMRKTISIPLRDLAERTFRLSAVLGQNVEVAVDSPPTVARQLRIGLSTRLRTRADPRSRLAFSRFRSGVRRRNGVTWDTVPPSHESVDDDVRPLSLRCATSPPTCEAGLYGARSTARGIPDAEPCSYRQSSANPNATKVRGLIKSLAAM